MSLVSERKKCSVCGKFYNWNPSALQTSCPYCHGILPLGKKKIKK